MIVSVLRGLLRVDGNGERSDPECYVWVSSPRRYLGSLFSWVFSGKDTSLSCCDREWMKADEGKVSIKWQEQHV